MIKFLTGILVTECLFLVAIGNMPVKIMAIAAGIVIVTFGNIIHSALN